MQEELAELEDQMSVYELFFPQLPRFIQCRHVCGGVVRRFLMPLVNGRIETRTIVETCPLAKDAFLYLFPTMHVCTQKDLVEHEWKGNCLRVPLNKDMTWRIPDECARLAGISELFVFV